MHGHDRRTGGWKTPVPSIARRWGLVGGILATVAAVVAPGARAADVPISGGAVTFGVTTEPACFNPHRSTQQNAYFLIRNYVDSLVGKAQGGKFVPWLAREWSISPDGRTYDF